jgi:hypothetical protein
LLFAFCFSNRPDVCGGIETFREAKRKSKKGAFGISLLRRVESYQLLFKLFAFSQNDSYDDYIQPLRRFIFANILGALR